MKLTSLNHGIFSERHLNTGIQIVRRSRKGFLLRLGAFLILSGLLVSSFYSSSSASKSEPASKIRASEVAQNATPALPGTLGIAERMVPVHKTEFNPVLMPFPPPVGETIETFAADCTTPKSSFVIGDTVCVKLTGFPTGSFFPHRLLLGNANSTIIQMVDITTDPQTFSFTVTATSVIGGATVDNRGSWLAVVLNPFFYFPEGAIGFTVADPANATADSAVATTVGPGNAQAGTAVTFELQVKNYGPDSAATVSLTNAIPANTTFVDFQQTGGPTFDCDPLPSVGASSGSTTCTISSLVWPGPAATFTATYQINAGTAVNTAIVNTATLTSTTNDQNTVNNSTSDTATVVAAAGTACSFDCPYSDPELYPNGLVVTATGPNGAVVNFAAAINVEGDCGAISASPSSGSTFPIGTTTVNVSSGAGPTCSFTIEVVNTPAPTISCPVDKIVTDTDNTGFENVAVGAPTTTPSSGVTVVGRRSDDIPATYDDDGNVVTPEVIVPLTDPYPIGTTGITWTVTDSVGRTATCTQRIVVLAGQGRQPVSITCPAPVNVEAPAGACQATVSAATIGTPTTNPSDSNVDVTSQRSDGRPLSDPFPVGTTTITWTATDDLTATSASCVQNVTVTVTSSGDTTPPTLTVPLNVSATTSTCTATLDDELGTAEAEDPIGTCNGSVTITRTGVPAGFIFPTGTTVITYTATDAAGNTTTGTQNVTVTESPAIPPTVDAPANVSVNTGPSATICGAFVGDATLGTATASDNCPGVTVMRSGVPAGNIFPVGDTIVTYTATDRSGNMATDTQTVTVVDNTVPIVTPPAAVTLFTGAGATSCGLVVSNLDASLGTGSATDNCPGVGAVTRSGVPAGNNFPVGTTTVTYSATDAYGNTGSATQVVTVVDNTPPLISCPASITIEPTCPTGAKGFYTAPVGTDNCPGATTARTAGLASGSVFPIGTTTVTHTVTDGVGLTASCSFTVTVLTPQAVIQNLINSVSASSLTGTQKNGLLAKLNAALTAINGGGGNACAKLSDFVNNVGTLISHGDLTAAQGNAWISSANHVRNTIGCTNDPCT
ncbi:MAG: HYR domain-containing protein [Pyrinomonadaceae bacterium]